MRLCAIAAQTSRAAFAVISTPTSAPLIAGARLMSSIESAPQTMPAINARILTAPFAPPFAAIVNRSVSNIARLHRCAIAMTGTNPTQDTSFGSSNRTPTARRARDNRIQRMPLCPGLL